MANHRNITHIYLRIGPRKRDEHSLSGAPVITMQSWQDKRSALSAPPTYPRGSAIVLLLFLQRIDIVIEADFRSRSIDKMKIDFAAGLQSLDASSRKAERSGELTRINRLVLQLHLLEGTLEDHIGGVIALLVVRRFAGERRWTGDLLGLEDDHLADEA